MGGSKGIEDWPWHFHSYLCYRKKDAHVGVRGIL